MTLLLSKFCPPGEILLNHCMSIRSTTKAFSLVQRYFKFFLSGCWADDFSLSKAMPFILGCSHAKHSRLIPTSMAKCRFRMRWEGISNARHAQWSFDDWIRGEYTRDWFCSDGPTSHFLHVLAKFLQNVLVLSRDAPSTHFMKQWLNVQAQCNWDESVFISWVWCS